MSRKRRRRSSHGLLWLLLIALGSAAGLGRYQQPPAPPGAPASTRPSPPAASTKVFQVLLGATLQDDKDNDGDSFKVLHEGAVHLFRLHFVDCAEKRRHSYNAQRLQEQGLYFGGLNEADTVALGLEAKAFTEAWLRSTPVTICTKWQQVYNDSRHYAFVLFPDGEDLSAKLVRAGLARIHTTGATLPDGRAAGLYQQQLRAMEADAKAAGRGGWRRRQ